MPNTIQILKNCKITDFDAGTVFSGMPSGKTVKGYTPAATPLNDPCACKRKLR